MISVRKLAAFVAIAESGGFTAAARELGVSAAALSARLSELEARLGVALLHRTTRRVELTAQGERFLVRAKRVLDELGSITEDLDRETALERGRIVVSCVPTLAGRLFPDLIASFSQQHPLVTIQIVDESTDALRARLLRSEADFGIGPHPGYDLAFEPVAADAFVLACRVDDPIAQRKSISGKDLATLPLVTLARGSNVRSVLDNYFSALGLVLHPRFEVQHHYTLGTFVQAGLGYGPLPGLALQLTALPTLVGVPIARPVCEREVGIVTRPGDRLSPAAAALLDATRARLHAAVHRTGRR